MASVTNFKRSFTPKWQFCLLTLLSLILLGALGVWQIARAHQKQQMLLENEKGRQQLPVRWTSAAALPKQYQRIEITGQLQPMIFLLDNQHHDHQFGYDVISPLLMRDGQIILIDRGWLPGDITRQVFPRVESGSGTFSFKGQVYYPSTNHWVLGEVLEKKRDDLVIIEQLDLHLMSQFLHKLLVPFIIRLEPDEASPYVRQWPTVSMSPSRHFAYAIQWFAMALVVLILFITLNLKKHDEKK